MKLMRIGSPFLFVLTVAFSQPIPPMCLYARQASQAMPESPGTKPSPEVQELTNKALQLLQAKQPEQALQFASEALAAAQRYAQAVDEAVAHRCRAVVLQQLEKTDEAVSAWQQADAAWERAGDGPGEVEALSSVGILLAPKKPDEAAASLSKALSLGKAETKRRLGAAQALHQSGDSCNLNQRKSWELLTKWADKFLVAALEIRERLIPDSLETADTLALLGHVALDLDDMDASEGYSKRALAIVERRMPESLTMARVLNQLGELEHGRDNLLVARDYYQRALVLLEKLDPNSYDSANTLNDLGNTTRKLGDLGEARNYYERALANREKVDPNSHAVARLLNNLGITASAWGNLGAARAYLERSRAIDERLGYRVPDVLLNLGTVAADEWDFATARDYYLKALASFKGGGIPVALSCLGNLASRLGDLPAAADYHQRALEYDEKDSSDSLDVATDLKNLGQVEQIRGNFVAARDYYERALAIREKRAPESLDVAASLDDLGDLARTRGELASARQHFEQALVLQEKLAPGSLVAAGSTYSLGEIAALNGDWATSESHHHRALAIRERLLGPNHPEVAGSLATLAAVQVAMGKLQLALANALRAERIGSEHLRLTSQSLPERQALLYASARPSGLDLALTLVAEGSDIAPASERDVWDALIRSRALVLDEMASRHRQLAAAADPAIARLAGESAAAHARLARLVVRGPGDVPQEKYLSLLVRARTEKEEAERALAEKSLSFRQQQTRGRVGLEEVVAALPPNSALVAFVRYNRHQFNPQTENGAHRPVPSYLAFIQRSGRRDVKIVSLGIAEELDAAVSALRDHIIQELAAQGRSARRNEARYRTRAGLLRGKLWDPVAAYLYGAERVFIVPDGTLNLVNFSALPTGRANYLIETGPLIHYISAERDLAFAGAESRNRGLLALAAPDFDETGLFAALAPETKKKEQEQPAQLAAWRTFRGNRPACAEFASLQFAPLPASAPEAENIVTLWERTRNPQQTDWHLRSGSTQGPGEVLYLSGQGATEAAFKQQAPGKRVLHLATHAFFAGARCGSALEPRPAELIETETAAVTGENPLLLSGLALAGANHRKAAGAEEEDGILTAEEIASLNLDAVEWAVLSACDTGTGEIRVSEGVFGLRRAFHIAGARTVLMSLWPVEDTEARKWMKGLYEQRLVKKAATAESVREASLAILRSRRAKGISTHPAHWASFVAAGDWN